MFNIKEACASVMNPVLSGQFADPDLVKFGEKYYIYPTTDGFSGWSGTKFHVFSSNDLLEWEDEGIIVDVAANSNEEAGINEKGIQTAYVPWAIGSAWAPCVAQKDGKYYFYFCAKRESGDSCIGVAVSDAPTGPFVALDKPLITIDMCREASVKMGQTIDPSYFEEDGHHYLVFGNGEAAIVELNEDLVSVKEGSMRGYEGLFDFRESLIITKRDGLYHFTWSCDDTGSENYHINYGVSKNLFGPVEYKYIILSKSVENDILGTGHHSIMYDKDNDAYVIAYHRFLTPLGQVTEGFGFHREVCLDLLTFGKDGLMNEVKPSQNFGYLFVHFTGEHDTGEQIYFSLSKDGLHWQDCNNDRPVIVSDIGEKGVRDPFITKSKIDGNYYIIATDLRIANGKGWGAAQFGGSLDMIIFKSEDLINWSKPWNVSMPLKEYEAGCVWAPETVYDEANNEYLVFFAAMTKFAGDDGHKQRIFSVRTKDFVNFTEPELFIERDNHVIDTTMAVENGIFYRFSKDETTKNIRGDKSRSLLADSFENLYLKGAEEIEGVEGPEIYWLYDKKCWCLIMDYFATGGGYKPFLTKTLENPDFKQADDYDMGRNKKRHGSVIGITKAEYNAVCEKYGI